MQNKQMLQSDEEAHNISYPAGRLETDNIRTFEP